MIFFWNRPLYFLALEARKLQSEQTSIGCHYPLASPPSYQDWRGIRQNVAIYSDFVGQQNFTLLLQKDGGQPRLWSFKQKIDSRYCIDYFFLNELGLA